MLRKLITTSPFLKHNAVFFIGSLSVAALNYLYYLVLGRMLSPSDFGEVQTLTSLFAQAAIFLSILTYVTIHVTVNAPDKQQRNQTLLALEFISLASGGALLAAALLSAGLLREFFNFSSVWPFFALIAALGISIPTVLRMSFLRGNKLYAKASFVDGIGSASKLVLSPLLVLAGLRSFGAVTGLALSQVISLVVGTVWSYRRGLKGFGFRRRHMNLDALRPQMRYALAVFMVSGCVAAMLSLDMIAVKHYFQPDQAGTYAGMTSVARIVFYVTAPFTGVLLTLVSLRAPEGKNLRWLKGSIALILLFGGGATLFLTLFPDFMIRLFIGSKYLLFSDSLPKLSLAMLLLGLANTLLMYQIAMRRFKYGILAISVTFLTVGMLYMRHNTPEQVVEGILAGSVALVIATITTAIIHSSLTKAGHGSTAGKTDIHNNSDV